MRDGERGGNIEKDRHTELNRLIEQLVFTQLLSSLFLHLCMINSSNETVDGIYTKNFLIKHKTAIIKNEPVNLTHCMME